MLLSFAVVSDCPTLRVERPPSRALSRLLHALRGPGIGAGIAARGGDRQAAQVVRPAFAVGGGRAAAGKVAMDEPQSRAAARRRELDLHGRGAGRERARELVPRRLPPERVDESPRRLDLHDLAAQRVTGRHLDAVAAADARIEAAPRAPPTAELHRID